MTAKAIKKNVLNVNHRKLKPFLLPGLMSLKRFSPIFYLILAVGKSYICLEYAMLYVKKTDLKRF